MRTKKILALLFVVVPFTLNANPLYSPTWGFSLDLPSDYLAAGGDNRNRFSFTTPDGAILDIVVYGAEPGKPAPYQSVRELARDVQSRIGSSGDTSFFAYRSKEAAILELVFRDPSGTVDAAGAESTLTGWGLGLELEAAEPGGTAPFLVALAFGPAQDLETLHLSVLDSFACVPNDRGYPGPVTVFVFPAETAVEVPLKELDETARFYAEDEEANQYVIDREYSLLPRYADSETWEDAWARYYRTIYRDSRGRLENAAFVIERNFNARAADSKDFAEKVLGWVQSFTYERDLSGADFVSLVTAARDGRGDCDTRAMLWALVLNQAHIPAAMMVSVEYSHAMGLVNLEGQGARFNFNSTQWLVAETTAHIALGLIGEDVTDASKWLGIALEQ